MIKKGLTSNQLKIIAISAMLLHHIVAAFISHETMWGMALRIPGRITAPIMCYLMSESFHYTSDNKKYLLRMFLFAVISHFPYNLCMGYLFSCYQRYVDVVAGIDRFDGRENGEVTSCGEIACGSDLLCACLFCQLEFRRSIMDRFLRYFQRR